VINASEAPSGSAFYRDIEPGDFPQVARLLADVFGTEVTEAEFAWKYAARPGSSRSFVAVRDDRVVFHAGIRRHDMVLEGRRVAAYDIVDGCASPDARGGVHGRSDDRIHAMQLAEPDVLFSFGFTHPALARQRMRDGIWRGAEPVGECHLDRLDPPAALPRSVSVSDVPPDGWDERWRELESEMTLVRVRDSAYLRWRYTDHPGREYAFVSAGDGLAVVRTDGPIAYLMELLADRGGDAASLARLALAAERVAADAGANELVTFFAPWSDQYRVLTLACGYRPVEPVENLFVLGLDPQLPVETIRSGFFYSMGDWDTR
jgi:Acetyltransferase (GNAT) domain